MTFPDMPQIIVEVGFLGGASTQNYFTLDDPTRGVLDSNVLAPDLVFTDISYALQGLQISAGASSRANGPLVEYEAGTMTVLLKNNNRDFDPLNQSGPYWVPDQTVVIPV